MQQKYEVTFHSPMDWAKWRIRCCLVDWFSPFLSSWSKWKSRRWWHHSPHNWIARHDFFFDSFAFEIRDEFRRNFKRHRSPHPGFSKEKFQNELNVNDWVLFGYELLQTGFGLWIGLGLKENKLSLKYDSTHHRKWVQRVLLWTYRGLLNYLNISVRLLAEGVGFNARTSLFRCSVWFHSHFRPWIMRARIFMSQEVS